ncbi:TPA: hypothetical protein ACPVZG_005280 [Vibrio parahaemolyticus]
MTVECLCGGKVKYDSDGCGHEWLTCEQCKFEVETYQSPCIKKVWEGKMLEKSKANRRYLSIAKPE